MIKITLAILVTLVAIGALLSLKQPEGSLDHHHKIFFEPRVVDTTGTYPGEHFYHVQLFSSSLIRNVHFAGNCSCVKILHPTGNFDIAPDKPTDVDFTYTSPDTRLAQQRLMLISWDSPEALATLPITGQLRSILKRAPGQIALSRHISNSAAKAFYEIIPQSDLTLKKATTSISNIDVDLVKKNKKDFLEINLGARADSALVDLPIDFEFAGKGFSGVSTVDFPMKLISNLTLIPANYWLGKVKPGSLVKCECSLESSKNDLPKKLSIVGVSDVLIQQRGNTLMFNFTERVPRQVGLFGRPLTLIADGKPLTTLQVSGIAQD